MVVGKLLKDNAVAESVLYKYPTYQERTVICCSTMSGCNVGCRFCGAGDYFVKNLSHNEIISQVDHCISETKVDSNDIERFQIMFMSMGEPLLNFKNLRLAIKELHKKYPNASLLISSIGPNINYDPFIQLSNDIPKIGLQFSVHESTDERRNILIPFKNKLPLKSIAKIGETWYNKTKRKPFFNYCAGDHNSSNEDVKRLYCLFDPNIWECTISVICERNEGLPAKNDHQISLAKNFSEKMLNIGYNVRVFDPSGQDDIGGGCGQLWFVQKWMQENPDLSRPSIGKDLPIIHTPIGAIA